MDRLDDLIDEKPLAYCYNCKSTFSYDNKTLYESETMSVKCPICGTDICFLDWYDIVDNNQLSDERKLD